MTISIRDYQEADLRALADLFTGSVRNVASRDYHPDQIDAWAPLSYDEAQWTGRLAKRPTFVATAAGRIVGFSDLDWNGYIDMMFVHHEHQGRGVAKALMHHIETRARDLGMGHLFSEASITARPFFEKCGFRVVAPQDVELRGQNFRNYRMMKTF